MEPIIVDTSVWIDFFKGIESQNVQTLSEYLENDFTIFMCPTIIQEILQGITNDKQFKEVKEYLLAFPILNDDGIQLAISAAKLYRSIRKKGITIRKSNDCIIAHYALKYSIKILHQDRDFDMILDNYPKEQ